MSICYSVTPGGWKGLRRTPFASLTTAPPTIYFVPLSRNSYLAGPSPCPCPGVDTPPQSLPSSLLHLHPPVSISILPSPSPSPFSISISLLHLPSPLPSSPYSYLHYCYPLPSSCLALRYLPSLYPSLWQDKPRHVTTPILHFEIQKK